jgi:hypothetical protein
MNPLIDRNHTDWMVIGTFGKEKGQSASSFETTYRDYKHKFFKGMKKKLKATPKATPATNTRKDDEEEEEETPTTDDSASRRSARISGTKRTQPDDDDDAADDDDAEGSGSDTESEDEEQEKAQPAPPKKKGRKNGPPAKKSKKELKPKDVSQMLKTQHPPVLLCEQRGRRGINYSPPGRTWLKTQQQNLRLIQNFLNSLRADEGIKATREGWTAVIKGVTGGSEDGGDHNQRAFVWLLAAVLYMDVKKNR